MHEGDFVPAEPIFLERIAVPERVTAPLAAIALGRNAQAQGGVGDDVEPRDSRVHGAPHVVAEPTAPRALRARRLRRPYRNEVPQHHNRDSPSSRVGCGPRVLSGQHGCGCVRFGTKRPQVQVLSPRPCFHRSEALTRVGEGLSCRQCSSKIRQVQQRRRELTRASKGLPACAPLRASPSARAFA